MSMLVDDEDVTRVCAVTRQAHRPSLPVKPGNKLRIVGSTGEPQTDPAHAATSAGLDPIWAPSGPPMILRRNRKPPHMRRFSEVGATGFEPATFRPPAECATRLRHAPRVERRFRGTAYVGSIVRRGAGDRDRTGDGSLEGSCVTNYTTPALPPIIGS